MLLRLLNTFMVMKITTKCLNELNAKFKHFSRILALQQTRVSRLKTSIFKKLKMWKFHLNNSGVAKTTNFFLALLWEPTVWCTLWPSLVFSTFSYIFPFSTKIFISLEGNTPYFTLAEISLFHRERRCNTPYITRSSTPYFTQGREVLFISLLLRVLLISLRVGEIPLFYSGQILLSSLSGGCPLFPLTGSNWGLLFISHRLGAYSLFHSGGIHFHSRNMLFLSHYYIRIFVENWILILRIFF